MVKNAEIDPALLKTVPAPPVPKSPVTNRAGATYLNNLKAAQRDCTSKMEKVRDVVEATK